MIHARLAVEVHGVLAEELEAQDARAVPKRSGGGDGHREILGGSGLHGSQGGSE